MEQEERRLHGSSFGAAALAYAEHRPDYAPAAVRWALESAPSPRVLDLGAGTGKLTGPLVTLGVDVIAVEPDPAMLTALRRALPAVRALPGSAEAIPLPDAAVDAVLAGHALHWFDMAVAGPEWPGSSHPAASWPACGTSWTTGSTGSPDSSGSAEARPSARVTRSAAGAPRRQACTCSEDSPRSTSTPTTAARDWYTELLGVPPYYAYPPAPTAPAHIEFRIGDDGDELGVIDRAYAPPGASHAPGGAVMHWHVDDLPATVERLLALGAKEYLPITHHGDESGSVTPVTGSVAIPDVSESSFGCPGQDELVGGGRGVQPRRLPRASACRWPLSVAAVEVQRSWRQRPGVR